MGRPKQEKKNCSIFGCDRNVFGHGLCQMHYDRNRRHGDPNYTTRRPPIFDIVERLNARVVKTETCWIWQGTQDGKGYGITSFKGRNVYVHRITYEMAKGPIPSDKVIDHLCRVPLCCNPAHLEAVTQRTNLLRGTGASARNAVKTHCPKGHPYIPENIYMNNKGQRTCRTCTILRERSRRAAARLKKS